MNRVGGQQMSSTKEQFSFAAKQEEQHLLVCARAGDPEAFEKLVSPHWNVLLRVSQRILRSREDAEDAVQIAFLNAWRNLDAFQGRSRFSSWLTRITINSAFMRLRANRCKNEVSLDEMVHADAPTRFHVFEARPNPEDEFSANEVLGLIDRTLNQLNPRYAEVLRMSVLQELTGKEAARILDVPVTTVKSRLYRARAILSRSLQPMVGSPPRRTNVRDRGAAALVPRTASSA
jgi:RNA polymerase sigma-70 factor (ECF subfamily)